MRNTFRQDMKKFTSSIPSYYEILKKDGKCYQLDIGST